MNSSVVLGQLLGIRAQVDALVAALVEEQEPTNACRHPLEDRRPMGSMGHVTGFKCLRCEQVVESTEHINLKEA